MSDQSGTVHADARGVMVATDGTLRSRYNQPLGCAACHHPLRARGYHQLAFRDAPAVGVGLAVFRSFDTVVAVCSECGRVEFFAVDAEPRRKVSLAKYVSTPAGLAASCPQGPDAGEEDSQC